MIRVAVSILIVLILSGPVFGQNAAGVELQKLSDEILTNLQKFYPVQATAKGIHDYDFLFTDYSAKAIKNEIAALKKFLSRLNKIKADNLPAEGRINHKLLKSNVETALQNLERLKWHQRNPYLYIEDAVNGVYLLMTSNHTSLHDRAQNIIERWKLVPDLLAQAKVNLKHPVPNYTGLARENCLSAAEFYRATAEDLKNQFPELATTIGTTVNIAVTAINDYHRFLGNISLGSNGSFAIGKEEFNFKLKNENFLDYDADSLLKIGEALFRQADSNYRDYERYLQENPVPAESLYIINCITRDELFRYYGWEVEQTQIYLSEKEILTVPENIGKCAVQETPLFMRNLHAGIHYQPPGAFNPDQTGYFYVRPVPDTLDEGQREARYRYIHRRGFKGSVVHEAYPGHHLHCVMMSRLADKVRKWQENILSIEGWALYSEEMMYEAGFYNGDSRQWLAILGGIRFRAARIIADVKLHTGQFSLDQTLQWMTTALDGDSLYFKSEIDRYSMNPTVPMSYLIGKTELWRLRDAMKARDGERFSLKDFHDRFLAEGAVPPRLLWEIWNLK